jgi:hypothetical protein
MQEEGACECRSTAEFGRFLVVKIGYYTVPWNWSTIFGRTTSSASLTVPNVTAARITVPTSAYKSVATDAEDLRHDLYS